MIFITILILMNLLVKGAFLSSNSLGGDEPFSVYHAQMDVDSIISLLSNGNNPPLYEIILSFWIKLFGISEFSVRFPSLIFSCLTVFYIYKLGRNYLNNRIAIYASLIFIFSNYHILFAHEARVYSLLGFLSVTSMYYFMGIIDYCYQYNESIKRKVIISNVIILVIVDVLIIYAHYFGFFILVIQFLYFVFNKSLVRKYWKQLTGVVLIIGIFYLPNIFVVYNRFIASSSTGTWVKAPNGIEGLYNMIRQFSNAPVVAVVVITVLLIFFIKIMLSKIRNKREVINKNTVFILFWFFCIFFFMFGISYYVPMFLDRYLMPTAVAFSLVIAISVDYIVEQQKYRYIVPMVIIVLFISTVKPNISNKRNVKETIDKIKETKDSNTLVLLSPSYFLINFAYYYDIETFKNYNEDSIYSNIITSLKLENVYGVNNIDEIDVKKWKRIVFLDAASSFSFPYNNIKKELDANYALVNQNHFQEIFDVYEYVSIELQ